MKLFDRISTETSAGKQQNLILFYFIIASRLKNKNQRKKYNCHNVKVEREKGGEGESEFVRMYV